MRISRNSRNTYQFEDTLFSEDGRAQITEFAQARQFAWKMSTVRGRPIPASEINAMALMDEVLRIIVRQYEMQNPGVMARASESLEKKFGGNSVDGVLTAFVSEFPPQPVYRAEQAPRSWLAASTSERAHRQVAVEELLHLHITHLNPAIQPYNDLFDDTALRYNDVYPPMLGGLSDFFNGEKGFGAEGHGAKGQSAETLIQVLRAPALASPYSLEGQLQFLLTKWGNILGEAFIQRLLRGIDFVKEEAIRGNFAGGFGGDAPVPTFSGEPEYERFSPDKDWMPRLVLMAKNSYVWLDQLSRQYGRDISRLDQIPDEELDLLARRGFTGLWLIGLWERSIASKRIKQSMGQEDAVASAYSLMNYDIATDLGGWAALENLRWRAWQRGIRLSADMVPNHMGIDSRWVADHPDWFLSLPFSPYPNYSFNSQDLSNDERVGIFLEDHYYDKTDAAVVFKRVDRWTGDTRYIYHGNDGTSMPWNDTAQLDYLKAEVREAVIQTILHVARNFPIIRFDAAMTLAKKHVQRLWFPEPGAGGAIPSRAEHGMSKAQFDAAIPEEFWREVVDRVAVEVPDTLLLAEAFWLMEGYFVRTLGMHRVYNSAFMHMMRDEDNGKYRTVMKNVLEFDPRILQRFVNFMNNPDEKTAAEQFGKADKYFGVCVVLSTLPGLPMYGHGQVEGYREKYGMEFRRPKWDEQPDHGLINYHDQVIFPILHHRAIFAGVENFRLYDFFDPAGHVNEDVFAYSNRLQGERSLVVYHNKFAEARGWVRTSVGYADGLGIVQQSLSEGLGLPGAGYVIFRDSISGQEYIRTCHSFAENGLYIELGAYKCQVFLDWRFVDGPEWAQLHDNLNGAGTWSVQAAFDEMFGKPRQGKVNVNGVEIAYARRGRGPALLLIHGYPLDRSTWNETAALLENNFDVITPDLRGFGGSSAPESDYSIEEMAADLAGLLAGLGIEKAHIAGHSMGGYVALAFARAYPAQTLGLGLISTQTLPDTPEKQKGRLAAAEQIAAEGVELTAANMPAKLAEKVEIQEACAALIRAQRPQGLVGALKAMAGRIDAAPGLASFTGAAAIIHGKADALIPFASAEEMKAALPHAKLTSIPTSGHMPMLENPQAVAEALKALTAK